jgi:PAS domain S-box-containing protein
MEMCITSFNRAAEEITGISRNDAVGLPCFEVLRANVCEENCLLRKTIDTRQPVKNVPVYILRADKKLIPIGVTTALLKDSADRIVGGVETFRDLTAVDKLRKELRKTALFRRHREQKRQDAQSVSPSFPRLPKAIAAF